MKYWINLNKSDAAFANMSAAIKSEKRTNDDEYLKPFPTCQTCPSCKIWDGIEGECSETSETVTIHMHFCSYHPDFEGAKETKGSNK